MKVCTYKLPTPFGTQKRLGFFFNTETIVDVNLTWQAKFERDGYYGCEARARLLAPSSLSQFLALHQDAALEKLLETKKCFEDLSQEGLLKTTSGGNLAVNLEDEQQLRLDAPLDAIPMYRDFYAHEKHVKKGFEKRQEPVPPAWYEIPAYYKGGTTGFIGHEDTIPWPHFTQQLDYELELGLVIGRDGKNVRAAHAQKHIFGYTILNDVSARDIQRKEMSIRLGPAKGKDWCSVIGPVIVTADEFQHQEPKLRMRALVNGDEWSSGNSGDAHFSWAEMIEHLTMEEWVRATDFLGSGTVGTGCGLELDRWIKPGDVIELEIEGIGTLKNLVGTPNPKP